MSIRGRRRTAPGAACAQGEGRLPVWGAGDQSPQVPGSWRRKCKCRGRAGLCGAWAAPRRGGSSSSSWGSLLLAQLERGLLLAAVRCPKGGTELEPTWGCPGTGTLLSSFLNGLQFCPALCVVSILCPVSSVPFIFTVQIFPVYSLQFVSSFRFAVHCPAVSSSVYSSVYSVQCIVFV